MLGMPNIIRMVNHNISPILPATLTKAAVAALAILAIALAGCGSEDGSASPPATDGPGGPRLCEPVNVDLESSADTVVEVQANDFAFDATEYRVDAGVVTFEMTNNGEEAHELAFLPGGGPVPYTDGAPDEAKLEAAGAFELEAFDPGQSCNATYELAAGIYTVFCIVQTDDGENHYDKGMKSTLVVT